MPENVWYIAELTAWTAAKVAVTLCLTDVDLYMFGSRCNK